MQMESAFSETRRAAGLLQQFGGFPFSADHVHHLLFFWIGFLRLHRIDLHLSIGYNRSIAYEKDRAQ